MFLILVLLAVWGGVGAWWFMSRPEGRSTDSIGSFRQQLRVLERAGPTTVAPAYRMHTADLGVYGARRVPTMSAPGRALAISPAASRRRQARKRRRDVFYGLLAATAGATILGFLPGLSVMWWLAALLLATVGLYVVVLVQLQAAAADRSTRLERIAKVRYLPTAAAIGGPEPTYLLRSSAN